MTQKNVPKFEALTIGDLLVDVSGKQIQASKFFGTKSASDRPQVKTKRNFRFEAELAMTWYFNGIDQNFGFRKPVGGSHS